MYMRYKNQLVKKTEQATKREMTTGQTDELRMEEDQPMSAEQEQM